MTHSQRKLTAVLISVGATFGSLVGVTAVSGGAAVAGDIGGLLGGGGGTPLAGDIGGLLGGGGGSNGS